MAATPLRVDRRELLGASVVEPHGILDAASYGGLRNDLVKTAIDEPRAVIVDLDRLAVPDSTALSLFSSVLTQIAQWPGVPLLVSTTCDTVRTQLADYRLARYVPVYPSVMAAIDAIDDPPPRRIARRRLPNSLAGAALARRFVLEMCTDWQLTARAAEAVTVANELVENTLLHTYCGPSLRLELRRGLLTIAVYDDDPAMAHLIEPHTYRHRGLLLVAGLCRAWGCVPAPGGGKVVWAVLGI
jgi:anti-anti-sigma regulatory factor